MVGLWFVILNIILFIFTLLFVFSEKYLYFSNLQLPPPANFWLMKSRTEDCWVTFASKSKFNPFGHRCGNKPKFDIPAVSKKWDVLYLEFMLSNNDIINYDIRRWISMKTISKKHYEYAWVLSWAYKNSYVYFITF